jgi:uncharacterized protein (DUF1778 family)
MSSDRVIVDTIKMAQDLLRQNLPPTRHLTDAATVMRFRELIRSQAIRLALERSSDTVLAFALRAVEQVISDQSRTNRETITRLWDVLDDPHLNQALGLPSSPEGDASSSRCSAVRRLRGHSPRSRREARCQLSATSGPVRQCLTPFA